MEYPPIDFAYLRSMTDDTGIIQHGTHGIPNLKLGYTTDDNARALIVATKQYERTHAREDLDLAVRYLSFVHYSSTHENRFRNVMNYQREFLDEIGTEDCYGRTIWACGCVASSGLPENIRIVARKLFDDSIGWVGDLNSPRARAYSILGMCEYLRGNEDRNDLRSKVGAIADSLVAGIKEYGFPDWPWFEPYLTYGNAILPLGMLAAAEVTGRKNHKDAVINTITFLTDMLFPEGRLDIIGNDGWYTRGGKRAWYDQQTIDAGYTVYLYLRAHRFLGDKEYMDAARIAHSWFFGNNRSGVWVYDTESKGCFDAIASWGLNLNQGAESSVCFLLAQLEMDRVLGNTSTGGETK